MRAGRFLSAFLGFFGMLCDVSDAHEMRPAMLELREGGEGSWEMTWKVPARGPQARLALDVRLPEGCEWSSLPTREFTGDAFIDRGVFTRDGGLDGEEIYIEGLLSTFTDALVRIHRNDGSVQSERLEPSRPSLLVEARPDPAELTRLYFVFGMDYLREGWDHFALVLGLFALAGSNARFIRGFAALIAASLATAYLEIRGIVLVPERWTEVMLALGLVAVALAILQRRRLLSKTPVAPSASSVTGYGAILGSLHGFAFADGYASVGWGQSKFVWSASFLGAVCLGLILFSILLAGAARVTALRSASVNPSGHPFPSSANRFSRIFLGTAYLLGIMGFFWTLQRW